MASETLILDPSPGTPLDLASGADGFYLRSFSSPTPSRKRIEATSPETEGALQIASQYDNRTVTATIRAVASASRANWYTKLQKLQMKVGKVNAEGGVLKRIVIGGATTLYYDLLDVAGDMDWDNVRYALRMDQDITLTFLALPLIRGDEVTLSDHAETTLPALIFTETGIKGDVPALGRLVIDEDQASADQWWYTWGVQSRYYDGGTDAALFYEAETRTVLSGAGTVVGASGASGGGSNVVRSDTLISEFLAIVSTQAPAGGNHLTHKGTFRVYARVYTSQWASVALEWSQGDFKQFTRNAEVNLSNFLYRTYALIDLGIVRLTQAQWQGRIVARFNQPDSWVSGQSIDVDYILIVPIAEGSGQVSGLAQLETLTTVSARDEFNQTAGALGGKNLPLGALAWVASGSGTEPAVNASTHTVERSTTDGSARFEVVNNVTLAATLVQCDLSWTTAVTFDHGLVLRYVDTTHYLSVYRRADAIEVYYNGTASLAIASVSRMCDISNDNNRWFTLRAMADTAGRVFVWWGRRGQGLRLVIATYHPGLATGGELDDGKAGLYDNHTTQTSVRSWDNFLLGASTVDAAIFASRSAQLASSGNTRQDSAGAIWVPESSNHGDKLFIPPAGMEGRTVRMIVKASRNDPALMGDPAIDDISAKLYYTPRWLQVPDT